MGMNPWKKLRIWRSPFQINVAEMQLFCLFVVYFLSYWGLKNILAFYKKMLETYKCIFLPFF